MNDEQTGLITPWNYDHIWVRKSDREYTTAEKIYQTDAKLTLITIKTLVAGKHNSYPRNNPCNTKNLNNHTNFNKTVSQSYRDSKQKKK